MKVLNKLLERSGWEQILTGNLSSRIAVYKPFSSGGSPIQAANNPLSPDYK